MNVDNYLTLAEEGIYQLRVLAKPVLKLFKPKPIVQ
jgi:hypothetical protein